MCHCITHKKLGDYHMNTRTDSVRICLKFTVIVQICITYCISRRSVFSKHAMCNIRYVVLAANCTVCERFFTQAIAQIDPNFLQPIRPPTVPPLYLYNIQCKTYKYNYMCTWRCTLHYIQHNDRSEVPPNNRISSCSLKVHKNDNFFGSDFEFCTISLLVMLKY